MKILTQNMVLLIMQSSYYRMKSKKKYDQSSNRYECNLGAGIAGGQPLLPALA